MGLVLLLLLLNIIDLADGIYIAFKENKFNSKKLREGITSKLTQVILAVVVINIDIFVGEEYGKQISIICIPLIFAYIIAEFKSLFEHHFGGVNDNND